jgi:hypothetical protein
MNSALTFQIDGETAIGTLYSGRQFTINAADVEKVSALSWRVNKDGYLAHFDHLMSIELLMHRWLMGVTDSRIIVDHANRDRLDCRRANLRIVTPSQNHRRILLGSTKNEEMLVTLAQMYNIGASFFFGDYAGALNDVPAPPDDLVKRIVTKCQKYMKAPAPASAFAA